MKKLIFTFLTVFLLMAGAAAYLALTSSGARLLLRPVLSLFVNYTTVTYGQITGSLLNGLTLQNLELTHIKRLPAQSTVRVQELFVKVRSFRPEGILLRVDNARLRLQHSDPIVMSGTFDDGILNFNVFGPSLGLNEFKEFIYTASWLKPVSGHVRDFDIYVKGHYRTPQIRGEALAERLLRQNITLVNVPAKFYFNLDMKNLKQGTTGYVVTKGGGELLSRDIAVVLKECRIVFENDMENPRLNLRGYTKIEDVDINIRISGTRLQPDIQLSSLPPLPRAGLIVMLATGKRWQGVEGALATGTLSPEVATDFLDYFFFGGRGQKTGQRFGIKDIDVTFTQDTQGIGVKKALTNKLDVGYGVEKTNANLEEGSSTTQTVGGEYKVTDKISVEMENRRQTQDETNSLETGDNNVESEDKVMLKFETKF